MDRPAPRNVARLDHGALPMVAMMHANGIKVDLPFLRTLQTECEQRKLEIQSSLAHSIGNAYQDFDGKKYQPFNIGSPDQVARLLFQHLHVQGNDRLQMTKSEKRETTSDDVLELYRDKHPAVGLTLDWRETDKILGTYVIPLQQWADPYSRVHTTFSATTAATGRLASRSPNLQNVPTRSELGKRVRQAFIASSGNVLVSNDLSQIEMRWAAHLAQDQAMMEIFWKDEDIHDQTACKIFGRDPEYIKALKKRIKNPGGATGEETAVYKYFTQFERLPSKTLGFGILYGQTPQGLLESISISKDPGWTVAERVAFESRWTLAACEALIAQWYAVYAQIKAWMELQFSRARRYGMTWDAFGRMRLVPEVYSAHKRIREEGLRKSGNHGIQASAQGTIKLAMAELTPMSTFFNTSPGICWPLLQIHDELITEVDRGQARDWADLASNVMEEAAPLSIPVKSSSDIAERWGDLK